MQAEDVDSESAPHFYVHWDYGAQEIVSLSEVRRSVQTVVAEEEERGFECVSASYKYEWYRRSGEENWYRDRLAPNGTPIECLAARN